MFVRIDAKGVPAAREGKAGKGTGTLWQTRGEDLVLTDASVNVLNPRDRPVIGGADAWVDDGGFIVSVSETGMVPL